jgi:hypothetical protein
MTRRAGQWGSGGEHLGRQAVPMLIWWRWSDVRRDGWLFGLVLHSRPLPTHSLTICLLITAHVVFD